MDDVVSNTSPLSYLNRLGTDFLNILPALFGSVLVPVDVERELAVGRKLGHVVPDPKAFPWIHVRAAGDLFSTRIFTGLDPGETGVLRLALSLALPVVILDDKAGRDMAAALRIRCVGTIGVLIEAKRRGVLPTTVKDALGRLRLLGFYASDDLIGRAISRAGET